MYKHTSKKRKGEWKDNKRRRPASEDARVPFQSRWARKPVNKAAWLGMHIEGMKTKELMCGWRPELRGEWTAGENVVICFRRAFTEATAKVISPVLFGNDTDLAQLLNIDSAAGTVSLPYQCDYMLPYSCCICDQGHPSPSPSKPSK